MNRFLFVAVAAVVYAPLAYFIEVFTRDEAIKALYTPAFAQLAQKLEAAPLAFHLAGYLPFGVVCAFLYTTLPLSTGWLKRFFQFLLVFSPLVLYFSIINSTDVKTVAGFFPVFLDALERNFLTMAAFFVVLRLVGAALRMPPVAPLLWQEGAGISGKTGFILIGGVLYPISLFISVFIYAVSGESLDVFYSEMYNQLSDSMSESGDPSVNSYGLWSSLFLAGVGYAYFYASAALQCRGFARILLFSFLFVLADMQMDILLLGATMLVSPVALPAYFVLYLFYFLLFFGLLQIFFGLGAKKSESAS